MQRQRHVADGVRQVPADGEAERVGFARDGGDVEELAGVVLDAGEQHERGGGGGGADGGEDVGGGQDGGAGGEVDADHGGGGGEVVVLEVAFDGVVVAGEGAAFEDDLVAFGGRPVEGCEEEVQVGG